MWVFYLEASPPSSLLQVKGPRGDKCWFNAWEIAASAPASASASVSSPAPAPAAPAPSGQTRPAVGDRVALAAGMPATGCLRPGEQGVVLLDDHSDQPFNIRGREPEQRG